MKKRNDDFHSYIGNKYSNLLVIGVSSLRFGPTKARRLICLCDCGNEKLCAPHALKSGETKSCGCFKTKRLNNFSYKHGFAGKKDEPEYLAWINMRARCNNINSSSFYNYGARGISVCKEWNESFEQFFADMGKKPGVAYSLDRIDNNGNYEKSNCRWATRRQQNLNTRRSLANRAIKGE